MTHIKIIQLGDDVVVTSDNHTHGMLEGCKGVVVGIGDSSYLPISVALTLEDGTFDPDVPFDYSELEVI